MGLLLHLLVYDVIIPPLLLNTQEVQLCFLLPSEIFWFMIF